MNKRPGQQRWTLSQLNTQSSIFQTFSSHYATDKLPHIAHSRSPKPSSVFSPMGRFCTELYGSSSHTTHGSFYRTASQSLLLAGKPWVFGLKNSFSQTFSNSGTYEDSRIGSLLAQKERQKRENESRKARAATKQQFIAKQLLEEERRRQRRWERRQRKRAAFQRRHEAAITIQCQARRVFAVERCNRARHRIRVNCARKIQRFIRNMAACAGPKKLLRDKRRARAATRIQSRARIGIARVRVRERTEEYKREQEELFRQYQNVVVVDIQKIVRGRFGRQRATRIRRKKERSKRRGRR